MKACSVSELEVTCSEHHLLLLEQTGLQGLRVGVCMQALILLHHIFGVFISVESEQWVSVRFVLLLN